MGFDTLSIDYIFESEPTPEVVSRFLNRCLELGCQTHQEGGTDTVWFSGMDHNSAWTETKQAFEALSTESGMVTLWHRGLDFTIWRGGNSPVEKENRMISLWIDRAAFHVDTTSLKASRTIEELAPALHQTVSPLHTRSSYSPKEWFSFQEGGTSVCEEIGWLTIFSEECIARFGRETLLSLPVWRVSELSTGDILLVLTETGDEEGEVEKVTRAIRTRLK